jgi:lipopolysaccharide heptosyltransferase II
VTRAEAWADARRILAVRLDAVGDVLMTTPAIRALKSSAPRRQVTLLTSAAGAAAAALVPEIDDVIVYDAPWLKATARRDHSRPDRAMVERIHGARFDAAVIFTVYSQSPLASALLAFLADIPLRLAHCRENPYQLLTDWVPDPEPARFIRHEVRRQLDLVAAIGCATADERLSLRVPPRARYRAGVLLTALGLGDPTTWMMMHPGATAPSRRYPAESFAAVGRRLVEATGRAVLITGSDNERELTAQVAADIGPRAHSIAGTIGFAALAALIARAPLLVSNNTGPVHVAAAVGTPVVDLYALTNPQHTPWRVPHRVLFRDVPCRNCYKSICPEGHHDCLRLVTPEQVVTAALELLALTAVRDAA